MTATPGAASESRMPHVLLATFGLAWLALAIAPSYRADWLLENALVFLTLPLLLWSWRRVRFSNLTYLGLFLFMLLHIMGAHYTYAEVPYNAWSDALFGISINELLGFERNHYDRLVHFLFGVLLAPLALELVRLNSPTRSAWRRLMAISILLSCSALYELLEWWAALIFGGDHGMAYLGTQGDEWDSHKDTGLALLGAILSVALLTLVGFRDRARRLNRRTNGTTKRQNHLEPQMNIDERG